MFEQAVTTIRNHYITGTLLYNRYRRGVLKRGENPDLKVVFHDCIGIIEFVRVNGWAIIALILSHPNSE